ncbi:MAG: hypothetical protein U0527_15120 [Candidatus Eisenbacteria bacterium]
MSAICCANADPHHVEVLPSYMIKVAREVAFKVGLGLDQWADGIVEGSYSTSVQVVDCSMGCTYSRSRPGRWIADG